MLESSPIPHNNSLGSSWTQEETVDLIKLWGKAEVLSHFAWGGNSNDHIYEGQPDCF